MAVISLLAAALLAQAAKVKEIRDVAYVEGREADPKKHKLDLYLPESDKPVAVVMWIHGGGWMIGDRSWYREVGHRFSERGIGMAAIGYRLSPGVKHPAHIEDCAAAFAWLRANVREHGGDPDRLFVSGQSAGGHLAALLASDPKYLEKHKLPLETIKGSIPMSGVYRIPPMRRGMFAEAFGDDREVCRLASPREHVTGIKAPMLVITEEDKDGIIGPSLNAYRRAVEEAKVKDVAFLEAKGCNHISIVINLARTSEDPVRAAMIEFVKKTGQPR